MEILFTEINGLRIAYNEKNARANNIIFFIHGNSVDKSLWRKQLSDEQFNNYHLIAFDLPGCGDSDKSNNPPVDYTLKGLGIFAANIIQKLSNNKPYIVAALSVGTNILAEALPLLTPKGIVMAGPCILGDGAGLNTLAKPNTHVNVVFTEDGLKEDVIAYATETSLSTDENDLDAFLKSYYTTDKILRSVIANCLATNDFSDEIANVQQKNITSLFVFGKDEKVVFENYLDGIQLPLWNNKIYFLEDASHLVNIDAPGAFNKLLLEYATSIF